MIDGTGKVRITDFGLAGASGEAIRAGTPAYMAPEQLAGQRGHGPERHLRARPRPLRDLHRPARARRQEPRRAHPQARAVGHRPAVGDRQDARSRRSNATILRCLKPEAGERPASALAVAARLARRRPARRGPRRRRDAVTGDGGGGRKPRGPVSPCHGCRRGLDRAVASRRRAPLSARDPPQPRAAAETPGRAAGSRAGSARARSDSIRLLPSIRHRDSGSRSTTRGSSTRRLRRPTGGTCCGRCVPRRSSSGIARARGCSSRGDRSTGSAAPTRR